MTDENIIYLMEEHIALQKSTSSLQDAVIALLIQIKELKEENDKHHDVILFLLGEVVELTNEAGGIKQFLQDKCDLDLDEYCLSGWEEEV